MTIDRIKQIQEYINELNKIRVDIEHMYEDELKETDHDEPDAQFIHRSIFQVDDAIASLEHAIYWNDEEATK